MGAPAGEAIAEPIATRRTAESVLGEVGNVGAQLPRQMSS